MTPSIRGVFTGLGHESGADAMAKAVIEGVAFAVRDSLDALRAAGTELTRVTAIGGGSRSLYWLKVIATVLNIPVDIPAEGDFGAAFGAARLGLIAATKADPLTVCAPPKTARTIEPDASLTQAFHDAHQRYRASLSSHQRSTQLSTGFFGDIAPVKYEGPDSTNPLAFRHYNPDEIVMGKRMEDHLRFAVAYWHSFAWQGGDPFGGQTFERPWFGDTMDHAQAEGGCGV